MKQDQAPVPQCEFVDVAGQALVTIAVKNGKLRMYPRRSSDVIAYYKEPGKSSPERPDQVRWVVRDLDPGQSIRIKAKNPGSSIFPSDEYVITPGCNSILSGQPQYGPGSGRDLDWAYSVYLMEDTRVVDEIDPMIIIKNDP